jgi:hypothetical protein
VIEVFQREEPIAAQHFLNRCQRGSSGCFTGTTVHRLLPDTAFFGGLSTKCDLSNLGCRSVSRTWLHGYLAVSFFLCLQVQPDGFRPKHKRFN